MTCRHPIKLKADKESVSPAFMVAIQWRDTRRMVFRTYREMRKWHGLSRPVARSLVFSLAIAMAADATEGSS